MNTTDIVSLPGKQKVEKLINVRRKKKKFPAAEIYYKRCSGSEKKMQIGKKIKMHEKRNLQQKDHKPLLPYEQRLSCTVQRTYLARVLFNTNKNERAG